MPERGSAKPDRRGAAPGGAAEWSAAIVTIASAGSIPTSSTEFRQELTDLNNERVVAETFSGFMRKPASPFPTSTRGAGTPGALLDVQRGGALR